MKDVYTKNPSLEEFKESLETKKLSINEKKLTPFYNNQGSILHILNWGDKLLCTDTEIMFTP